LKKKTNILIVGGTGFIGYHLAKRCIQKNWNVTSISTHKPKKIRYDKKIKYIICDISKKNKLKSKVIGTFDYVVNLGGYVDHSNKKKTFQSHYIGLKNLTEIFLSKNIKSFVQLGSGGEYGNSKSPHRETSNSKAMSVYYKSKLLSTLHLIKLFNKIKFPATILRLYQAYGPRQDINRLIPIVIDSCIKNKRFNCSEGKQLRDFIYIDDVVNAVLKCFKNKNSKGEIFNIGSGKIIKIKKLIYFINKKIGKGYPQYGKIKLRKDEQLKVFPSIKKAITVLKWRPKISMNNGLIKTIQFYKKNV
jgi:nucleoside-diphosphate-sugar epimerase